MHVNHHHDHPILNHHHHHNYHHHHHHHRHHHHRHHLTATNGIITIIIIMVNNIVKLNGLLVLYHNCSAFCIFTHFPFFSIGKLHVGISTADHAKRRALAMPLGHEAVTCPSTWSPWSSADVWMNCRPSSSKLHWSSSWTNCSKSSLCNLLPDVSSGTPSLSLVCHGHIRQTAQTAL